MAHPPGTGPLREYAPPQRVIRRPQQKVGAICGLATHPCLQHESDNIDNPVWSAAFGAAFDKSSFRLI